MLHMWIALFTAGAMGAVVAVVIAAFAVLATGNVIIWTVAGVKSVGRSFAGGFRRSSLHEEPAD